MPELLPIEAASQPPASETRASPAAPLPVMPDACIDLKVPKALREQVAQVFALTDGFCADHLDDEDAELCRRLVAACPQAPVASGAGRSTHLGRRRHLHRRAVQLLVRASTPPPEEHRTRTKAN